MDFPSALDLLEHAFVLVNDFLVILLISVYAILEVGVSILDELESDERKACISNLVVAIVSQEGMAAQLLLPLA